jgi:hypothetical protein
VPVASADGAPTAVTRTAVTAAAPDAKIFLQDFRIELIPPQPSRMSPETTSTFW